MTTGVSAGNIPLKLTITGVAHKWNTGLAAGRPGYDVTKRLVSGFSCFIALSYIFRKKVTYDYDSRDKRTLRFTSNSFFFYLSAFFFSTTFKSLPFSAHVPGEIGRTFHRTPFHRRAFHRKCAGWIDRHLIETLRPLGQISLYHISGKNGSFLCFTSRLLEDQSIHFLIFLEDTHWITKNTTLATFMPNG